MEFNEFKKFGLEVILKVLKKTDDEIKKYEALEDYEGVNTLTNDVLAKYERLYNAFDSDQINGIDKTEMKNLELSLLDIMKQNNLDLKYIAKEIELREELKGKSGKEAVKNLYNYQIKELEKKKTILLEKAEVILDKENALEAELREAIQEIDQMEVLEKLPEVRAEFTLVSNKINEIQSNLISLQEKIDKKWPCDIYGTISQDKLMAIFKETIN